MKEVAEDAEERPWQSAEAVTKSIRSKANPIETQIQNARGLLDGTIKAPVLKKEEFVLDWVLERLKSDKNVPKSAGIQIQLWNVLHDVWKHDELSNSSRASLFRKHNFPGILLDGFQDLVNLPSEEYPAILLAMDTALGVIQQRQWELKIRAFPEQGISIFGICLTVVNCLPSNQDHLGDSITMKISLIFQATLYDDRPTKKVAKSFAERCVLPALLFVANKHHDPDVITTVEQCIQEALFSKENLVDYINAIENPNSEAGFDSMMNTIASTQHNQERFDAVTHLPCLLKISLQGLKQTPITITPDQKSILAATFLSILDSFSIPPPNPESSDKDVHSVIVLSIRHLQKLTNLLQTFSEIPSPDSDTLTATLNQLASTCLPFLDFTEKTVAAWGWNTLAKLMTVDFDIVLDILDQIYPRIHSATMEFMEILVTTKFKIRNGVEFVMLWTRFLKKTGNEDSVLRYPSLTRLISGEIHKYLSPAQILELLHFLNENLLDPSIILPLKAILTGMTSIETIKYVSSYIKDMFQGTLLNHMCGKHASGDLFELWFLAMEISEPLARDLFHSKALKRTSRICQKSLSLYPLQCILRLKEVGGSSKNENKKVNNAILKSLQSTFQGLNDEMEHGLNVSGAALEILSALIRRWMPLINEVGDISVKKEFGKLLHAPSWQGGNTADSGMRPAELQFRAIMSSDLYESKGLIESVLEGLESGLESYSSPEDGVLVNGNVIDGGQKQQETQTLRCRNLLMMALKIPLSPLALHHQNHIFHKLRELDKAILSGRLVISAQNEKMQILILTRRGIARFLKTVAKTVIEDTTVVDDYIDVFKSLDLYTSHELHRITLEGGEILLRRLATSETSRVVDVLNHLVKKTVTTSLYKLQSLRAQLRTWLASDDTAPFYPDGASLLGIVVLEGINSVKQKLDESTLRKFEMMRFDALVQLRDSVAELLNGENTDRGIIRATFLFQSLRRLLADENTHMDLEGLLRQCGQAFTFCIKSLSSIERYDKEIVKRPLQEIFQIMCLQKAFDTPLVLCTAFISILKCGFSTPEIVAGFKGLMSTLNETAYDMTLQELVATALKETAAVEALQIAVGAPPQGDDLDFVFSKVLFDLTRNMLVTSSSDIFVSLLGVAQRILREKPKSVSKWNLDHLIANITIACSPACAQLEGSAGQDEIFHAIGSVSLTILQLYHHRLTKKYHLIVRMLQIMLHLFVRTTPMASRNIRETVSRPPPWLITSCSASSAQLFSRVLTMWTSPPSVTWRNNAQAAKRQLSSAAAKTGKAVSKHIPWFMMEYVALLAEYPDLVIEEPIQKALAPGLYSLFSILGKYEREMCMGALDGAGREIFKNLWEDWNKYGRFMEK